MNIYHNLECGLGDVISQNFSPINYSKPNEPAKQLARMMKLYFEGHHAAVVHRGSNQASLDIFRAMGVPIKTPEEVEGWTKSSELEPIDIEVLKLPTLQPSLPIPKKYILFNEGAGHPERCLVDPSHYRFIKRVTGLPIIKVGTGVSVIDSDIDLTNKTTVPETIWLAQHAVCVISAITFHRVWAQLFETRVIELAEPQLSDEANERTVKEYANHEYGITHAFNFNRWFKYPLQLDDYEEVLHKHCEDKEVFRRPAPKPTDQIKGMQSHWQLSPYTSDRDLMNRITTSENFSPSLNVLKWIDLDASKPLRVLDFGAGMLRNTAGLLALSDKWNVTAYDTQLMLDRGMRYHKLNKGQVTCMNDWEQVKTQKYDCILCSLVLQHIERDHLSALLSDFAAMTDMLVVAGRRALDNYKDNVWDVVAERWEPVRGIKGGGTSAADHQNIPVEASVLQDASDNDAHHTFVFRGRS